MLTVLDLFGVLRFSVGSFFCSGDGIKAIGNDSSTFSFFAGVAQEPRMRSRCRKAEKTRKGTSEAGLEYTSLF